MLGPPCRVGPLVDDGRLGEAAVDVADAAVDLEHDVPAGVLDS